ncbi:MAG: MOSC domain-containing protein [Pseudomonadales bacterium]
MKLQDLFDTLPQVGAITWIGIRPARRATMQALNEVVLTTEGGLQGDRYAGRSHKRQVTLIQEEHLAVIASCLSREAIEPEELRRNIVVKGVNLLALRNKTFTLGDVELEYTGLCHPCSRMEAILGPGGYNAMRGHGGITAKVLNNGKVSIGDGLSLPKDSLVR